MAMNFQMSLKKMLAKTFNHYNLDDNENFSTPNVAWFLLKKQDMTSRSNNYHLTEGDILKLGRISLLIRSINFATNENTSSHSSKILICLTSKKKYLPKSRFSDVNSSST